MERDWSVPVDVISTWTGAEDGRLSVAGSMLRGDGVVGHNSDFSTVRETSGVAIDLD